MNLFNLKKWKKDFVLFFERTKKKDSTRTKYSFIKAIQDLDGSILYFNVNFSSLKKGETFHDTIKIFDSFGIEGSIIRFPIKEYWKIIKDIKMPIINGGDGSGSHPSQCLLDLYTIYKEKGRIEKLKILIIGDIKHSRVAKSNINILKKIVSFADISGPEDFKVNCDNWINNFDEKLNQYDVIMVLRVQKERHTKQICNENYNKEFGLNKKRLFNNAPRSF